MEIRYEIKYSHRRSISLQVPAPSGINLDGEPLVLVKAPYGLPKTKILKLIEEKRPWLTKKINERQAQFEKIAQLGYFSAAELSDMKKRAREIIPQRVQHYASIGGFKYNKIFIKCQKTLWGSCSAGKNLNFNCLLVLMPLEVLDSVVVHELCHLHHMDHSRAFYREVLSLFPGYKKWDKWLKENGGVFLGRIPAR